MNRTHSLLSRALAALLLLLATTPCLAAPPKADAFPRVAAAERRKESKAAALLVVHYRRADGNYTGWNLWCWPKDGQGAQFAFSGSDAFGRYAVVPFATAPASAGFIVRKGDWQAKDGDQDRSVSFTDANVQEVWLVSGDATVHTDPGAIDLSVRLAGAFLDAPTRIALASSQPLGDDLTKGLQIARRGEEKAKVKVASVAPSKEASGGRALYTVTLAQPVAPADIARLEVRLPGAKPQTVIARNVLDDARFTPLDAVLGARCTAKSTTFTTWSPVSEGVDLLLYEGRSDKPTRTISLKAGAKGLWSATVDGDLHGTRYRYRFNSYGQSREVPDIHGVAATPDSSFTVVADLDRVNPEGWNTTAVPTLRQPTDEVLYEVHVRDFSVADESCPPEQRGTYLGLVHAHDAAGGKPSSGLKHLTDLGVTAVHLLPIEDFTAGPKEYNWGYWTALFNVPESNYATSTVDPLQPAKELKQAIASLHANDIRVVMDVVYNHTSSTGEHSPFDQTVPFYYFRTAPDGSLLNDTGVGNTFADERPMARKYIVDSLKHWLQDYKVDGFRFDLLGTAQPETVHSICKELLPIRSDITLYGEPWTGGGPIHFPKGAQKGLRMGVFNDNLRNAVRGDLDGTGTGFATGPGGDREALKRGVQGAIDDFTTEPTESVNYVSAHDNLTLWDKLLKAQPNANDATRRAMQKLALGIVLTSQGIPFIHGGCDFARTKGGNENSYNAGDAVNRFDWSRKAQYRDVHDYVRGLVAIRRAHPAFRMADDAQVRRAIAFIAGDGPFTFTIDGSVTGDAWGTILVAYNGEPSAATIGLPGGTWNLVADATRAGVQTLERVQNTQTLPPYSMVILWKP